MDFNRGISYVFDQNQACQIRHIQNSLMLKDQNALGYLKTLKDLLNWNNDTYYLGKVFSFTLFHSLKILYRFFSILSLKDLRERNFLRCMGTCNV
jgi:hypothetical protein